jgi:hypothetical protein
LRKGGFIVTRQINGAVAGSETLRKMWQQRRVLTALRSKRVHRLAWAALFLASLASFSVRDILAAYLLFTAVFLTAATAIAIFIAFDYVLDLGIGWVFFELRAALSVVYHFAAVPARVSASAKGQVSQSYYRGR